jgi:hypothetical protein
MNPMTSKCPKCGAEETRKNRAASSFACGSVEYADDFLKRNNGYQKFEQADQCKTSELPTLRAKLEKAKEWLRHSDICFATKGHWDQNNQWVDGPCICGLSEFLTTLE